VSRENESSCDLAALGRFQTRAVSELATRLTREAGRLIRGEKWFKREAEQHAGGGAIAVQGASFVLGITHRRAVTDEAPKKGGPEVGTNMCRGTKDLTASRMRCAAAAVAPRVCA
jgi:hypothetical protein